MEANDVLIYQSKLNLFIDYKWTLQYNTVAAYQSIYIIYIIMHSIWIIFYGETVVFYLILLAFNIFMFSLEISEMFISNNGLIGHFTESPWNSVDAIGKFSMMIFLSIYIFKGDEYGKVEMVSKNEADAHKNEPSLLRGFESYLLVMGTVA